MARRPSPPKTELDLPAASLLLHSAYKRSSWTVAELSKATGIGAGTVTITLNGFRHVTGEPTGELDEHGKPIKEKLIRVVDPTDRVLVPIARELSVTPAQLIEIGRTRAAEMLRKQLEETGVDAPPPSLASEEALAAASAAGRQTLIVDVLAAFSDRELQGELVRRERLQATNSPDSPS
ncbi:hypothetical protein PTQ19_12040 [Microbacterium esteraromaticum]|uniref:hypothetical protein n=1 Tax=Microbacterium esteraromaticum TaxID=57043 RepID=UPI002367B9B8|nr:hypothetical protein [Microbacterium esteraromaticum]WDH78241.1 hypothetical protein PTQ19_12040 [Microbacterium esteraromaticum]